MPSKSQKQHDFMVIACKDPDFAKKNDIDQKTACHFIEEDKKHNLWQSKKTNQVYHNWSKSKPVIREARLSDYKELAKMRKVAHKESEYVNDISEDAAKAMLETELQASDRLAYFAVDGSRIVGQLFLEIKSEDTLYIRLISTLHETKGTGLGKSLLDKAMAIAKDKSCKQVELIVNKENFIAIRFYEKYGFIEKADYNRKNKIMIKKV